MEVTALAVAGSQGVASGRPSCRRCAMAALLIGYARCSTDQQDLTAQRDGLAALGVDVNRVYDPTDPVGRLLFNVLAMVAEFESDLIRRAPRRA